MSKPVIFDREVNAVNNGVSCNAFYVVLEARLIVKLTISPTFSPR